MLETMEHIASAYAPLQIHLRQRSATELHVGGIDTSHGMGPILHTTFTSGSQTFIGGLAFLT